MVYSRSRICQSLLNNLSMNNKYVMFVYFTFALINHIEPICVLFYLIPGFLSVLEEQNNASNLCFELKYHLYSRSLKSKC